MQLTNAIKQYLSISNIKVYKSSYNVCCSNFNLVRIQKVLDLVGFLPDVAYEVAASEYEELALRVFGVVVAQAGEALRALELFNELLDHY